MQGRSRHRTRAQSARRPRSPLRLLAAGLTALVASFGSATGPVAAQGLATTFVTPFPKNNVYSIQVFGDSFAEGLVSSVGSSFARNAQASVGGSHTRWKALVSAEWDQVVTALEKLPARNLPEIAIVMTGAYDRASIRRPGRQRIRLGDEAWSNAYRARVERVMQAFRARNVALYWVGQPITRGPKRREHARVINDIVRDVAFRNQVRFIDIFDRFADEQGNYSDYGPDLEGKVRRLRWDDGLHFMRAGYDTIAQAVQVEINRDLTRAREARTVDLAGDETAIAAVKATLAAQQAPRNSDGSWRALFSPFTSSSETGSEGANAATRLDLPEQSTTLELKLPKGTPAGDKTISVRIERPAVPADIVAMVSRSDGRASRGPAGTSLALPTRSGHEAIAMISPIGRGNRVYRGGTGFLTQTPMFRVWQRGERLPPKTNRADDASWPRPLPVVLIPEPKAADLSASIEADPVTAFDRLPAQPAWDGPPLPERNPLAR